METAKLIQQARSNIRKKYKALKHHDTQLNLMAKKTFAPIIEPLKSIAKKQEDKDLIDFKECEKKEDENVMDLVDISDAITSGTSNGSKKRKQVDTSFFANESLIDNEIKRPAHAPAELSKLGPIAGKLFQDLKADPSKYDNVFGPKVSAQSQHILGSKRLIIFKNDNFSVGSKTYTGTKGLFSLIYNKKPQPDSYTEADKAIYGEILRYTNAHKQNGQENGKILASKGEKYVNIIRDLVNIPSATGRGLKKKINKYTLMNFNKNIKTSFSYWNDPNELVDRLKLLVTETQAGHNFLDNEIHEIIEELSESGYIY